MKYIISLITKLFKTLNLKAQHYENIIIIHYMQYLYEGY